MKKGLSILCIMLMAFSTFCGCGKKSNPEDIEEIYVEDSASEDDDAEEDVEEIHYEPTDEIKKATLQDCKIQIGNDVFKLGGYYTFEDFAKEYGSKYDLSEIVPENMINDSEYTFISESFEDEDLKLSISLAPAALGLDHVKYKDSIVFSVVPYSDHAKENTWISGGTNFVSSGYTYENIFDYFKNAGLTEGNSIENTTVGTYYEYDSDRYEALFELNENSLFNGFKPVVRFQALGNRDTGNIEEFTFDFDKYESDVEYYIFQ